MSLQYILKEITILLAKINTDIDNDKLLAMTNVILVLKV
jgi:hypothetical protein